MGGIFGGGVKQPAAQQPVAAAGVTIQTSCYGKVIPVVFGTAKLAPQLIWYGNFQTYSQTSGGGGGGGGKGGGGGSGGGTTTYTYTAGVQWLLAEGPIQAAGELWIANSATGVTIASQGYSAWLGTYPQTGWSFLDTYSTVQEQRTVPATAPYTLTAFYPGAPFTDKGVKDYAGTSFTSVATITAEGQYIESGGVYTFGAADAGRDVTLYYTSGNQQPPNQAMGYNGFALLANAALSLGSSTSLPNHNLEIYGFYSNSVTGSPDADPSLCVDGLLTDPAWGVLPAFPSGLLGNLSQYQSSCIASGLLISAAYTTQTQASQVLDDILTYTNADAAWTGAALNIIPRGDQAITANGTSYTPPAFTFALTDDDWADTNAATTTSGSTVIDPIVLTQKRQQDMPNQVTLEILDRANGYNPEPIVAQDLASIQTYGRNAAKSQTAHLFASAPAARVAAQLILQRGQIANTYQGSVGHHRIGIDIGDLGTIQSDSMNFPSTAVRVTEATDQMNGTRLLVFEEYMAGIGSHALHATGTTAGFGHDFNIDPGPCVMPIVFEAPVEIAATGLEVWLTTAGGVNWGGAQVWISTDGVTYTHAGDITGRARMGVLGATLPSAADPDTTDTLSVNLAESAGQLLSASQADADALHTLCYVDGELIAYETATLVSGNTYDLTYLRRGAYGTTISAHASGSNFARLDQAVFKYTYSKNQIGQTIYIKLLPWNSYGGALYTLAEVTATTHTIQGPPPPPNVTGFTVQQNGGAVAFNWDAITTDNALKGYDIAYGPAGTVDWASMTMLTEAAAGTEMTNASVPPGAWVFAIRARDIADQLSPVMATVTVTVTNESSVIYATDEATAWTGTLSGLLRHVSGVLVPESAVAADALTNAQLFTEFAAQPVATSTYTTGVIDTGSVDGLRLYSQILASLGPGGVGNVDTALSINYSQDNVSWSGWLPWTMGTVTARYVQMRLTQTNAAGACVITGFVPTVDVVSKTDGGSVTAAGGGTAVTFAKTFHAPPLVQATALGVGMTGATAVNVTKSGCTLHGWTGSTDSGGQISWSATGP